MWWCRATAADAKLGQFRAETFVVDMAAHILKEFWPDMPELFRGL